MLKTAYFLEKDIKNHLSVGGSAPRNPDNLRPFGELSPDSRVVTPVYTITNFVKFISIIKCGLLTSKKNTFCNF